MNWYRRLFIPLLLIVCHVAFGCSEDDGQTASLPEWNDPAAAARWIDGLGGEVELPQNERDEPTIPKRIQITGKRTPVDPQLGETSGRPGMVVVELVYRLELSSDLPEDELMSFYVVVQYEDGAWRIVGSYPLRARWQRDLRPGVVLYHGEPRWLSVTDGGGAGTGLYVETETLYPLQGLSETTSPVLRIKRRFIDANTQVHVEAGMTSWIITTLDGRPAIVGNCFQTLSFEPDEALERETAIRRASGMWGAEVVDDAIRSPHRSGLAVWIEDNRGVFDLDASRSEWTAVELEELGRGRLPTRTDAER